MKVEILIILTIILILLINHSFLWRRIKNTKFESDKDLHLIMSIMAWTILPILLFVDILKLIFMLIIVLLVIIIKLLEGEESKIKFKTTYSFIKFIIYGYKK